MSVGQINISSSKARTGHMLFHHMKNENSLMIFSVLKMNILYNTCYETLVLHLVYCNLHLTCCLLSPEINDLLEVCGTLSDLYIILSIYLQFTQLLSKLFSPDLAFLQFYNAFLFFSYMKIYVAYIQDLRI